MAIVKGSHRKPCPRTPGRVQAEHERILARLCKCQRRITRGYRTPEGQKPEFEKQLSLLTVLNRLAEKKAAA